MRRIQYLIVNLAFSISILFLYSCESKTKTDTTDNRVRIHTAPVIQKSVSLAIHTSGKLYSSTESKLSFKIPGILARLYADEGQSAQKGKLLAELDLVEMKAKVNQVRSAEKKAERDLERVKRLYSDSVATLEQLQNANTALDIASSNVKVAEFNLQHAVIRAPENGKILKKFAEKGELIGPGNPVFLYGSSHNGWVIRVGATDQQIIRLRLGDPATIRFDAYPMREFTARISEIEAIANPYTGTFEVELQLDPSDLRLYSGFVGKVEIRPAYKQKFSFIPIEALIEGNQNKGFVYKVNRSDNKVEKREILIETIVDDHLAVITGLEDIREVVTYGAPYLKENSLIDIIE
jgi:RND family efflux transporter MFP subunit